MLPDSEPITKMQKSRDDWFAKMKEGKVGECDIDAD
jgi:hypothetical protein